MKDKRNEVHRNIPGVVWLLPASLITLIPFLVSSVYYMVADDYLLNYIANGSFGRDGSAHLIYIRVVLGAALKALYGLVPGVNWYTVMLASFTIFSFAVFADAIWRSSHRVIFLVPVFLIDALIVPYFFSYTVVAFLTAAAGVVLWYCALGKEGPSIRDGVCGSLMVAAAFCLRGNSVLPTFILTSPLLVRILVRCLHSLHSDRRSTWKRAVAIPCLLFCGLLAASFGMEKKAYSDPSWKSFLSYTTARSTAIDYPSVDYTANLDAFRSVGLSPLDYHLLSIWDFAEKPVFSEEALRGVAAIGKKSRTTGIRLDYVRSVFGSANHSYLLLPLLALLILILLVKRYPKGWGVWTLACFYGVIFLLTFVRMRFVIRVASPVAAVSVLTLLVLAPDPDAGNAPKEPLPDGSSDPAVSGKETALQHKRRGLSTIIRTVAAAFLFLLFLIGGRKFIGGYLNANQVSRSPSDAFPKKAITEEIASHPDTLYIMDSSSLSHLYFYGTEVTSVRKTDVLRNVVRSGSWDTFSPRYYSQVSSFLSDPDRLLTSLVTSGNVRLVGNDAASLRDFLAEQTGREISTKEKDFDGTTLKIFSFAFTSHSSSRTFINSSKMA